MRPSDPLDEHAVGVSRKRLEVIGIGGEHRSVRLGERDDQRVDGRPAMSKPAQVRRSAGKRPRNSGGHVTGLEKPILVRLTPSVSFEGIRPARRWNHRWPQPLTAQRKNHCESVSRPFGSPRD